MKRKLVTLVLLTLVLGAGIGWGRGGVGRQGPCTHGAGCYNRTRNGPKA